MLLEERSVQSKKYAAINTRDVESVCLSETGVRREFVVFGSSEEEVADVLVTLILWLSTTRGEEVVC